VEDQANALCVPSSLASEVASRRPGRRRADRHGHRAGRGRRGLPDHRHHPGVQPLRGHLRVLARAERALRGRHHRLVAHQGNESYKVRSTSDAKSLAIQPTGVAVSPPICVGVEHPNFRFFGRRTSGTWGVLNVKIRWTGSDGRTNETVVGSLSGDPYKSWLATPKLPLATTLPLWQSGQSLSVRLVFDPEDFGGAWTIDDVYVDPYRR
jgi:hypothetical protein